MLKLSSVACYFSFQAQLKKVSETLADRMRLDSTAVSYEAVDFHPSIDPWTQWPMSPHFLNRRVSRLLGWLSCPGLSPVLVSIAFSFAFYTCILVIFHSLFFTCHWISFVFLPYGRRICTHSVDPSLTHFLGEFPGLGLALKRDVVVPEVEQGCAWSRNLDPNYKLQYIIYCSSREAQLCCSTKLIICCSLSFHMRAPRLSFIVAGSPFLVSSPLWKTLNYRAYL